VSHFETLERETAVARGDGDGTGDSSQDEISSVAELTGEIIEDIVHIGTLLAFVPELEETKAIIDDLSLKFFGGSYRILGIDLGLVGAHPTGAHATASGVDS